MRWRESLIARCCRRATRRSGLVLVVAAVLLAVCVRAQGGRQDDRFSPEPVEVRIGGSVYAIPRNYLVHVSRNALAKDTDVVVLLRALWPGLEPLSPDNAQLWKRRQPERQINIGLLIPPRDGYSHIRGLMELRRTEPEHVEYGLTRYRFLHFDYFASSDPKQREPDGDPITLRCQDFPESTKAHFEVERNCIVEYPLTDGVGLHYRFFMVNLEHWREIDAAVRSLVDSFRQREPS